MGETAGLQDMWFEPLIVKPIVNPFELPEVEQVTDEQIDWLKDWASVWDSVGASVWDSVWASVWGSVWDSVWYSVWASVRASVWDSVGASVWDSVGDSVRDSVGDSVWGFGLGVYQQILCHRLQIRLFVCSQTLECRLVPSFDGKVWRLHSWQGSACRV